MLSSWIAAAAVSAALSATPATDWQADYGKALAQTREDAKPLVVVIDVPGDAEQRIDPSLLRADGAFPLDSYQLCHVDASTEYGKRVAEVFRVTSFPHVAIIDKTGSVIVHRVTGQLDAARWKGLLAQHQDAERRGGERTYTVAKPVVESGAMGVEPSSSYVVPAEVYQAPRPYCPSCQLRNRGY